MSNDKLITVGNGHITILFRADTALESIMTLPFYGPECSDRKVCSIELGPLLGELENLWFNFDPENKFSIAEFIDNSIRHLIEQGSPNITVA